MPVPCARCEMPLDKWDYEAGTAHCRLCDAANSVRVFPAAFAIAGAARLELAMPGEASCFDHPNKRAAAACSQCGRYTCSLCSIEFGAETWCPFCVARGAGRAQAAKPLASCVLFDSITLALPLGSLLFWPLTALAAPAALVIGAAKWRQPLSLVRNSRWRLVLGMLFGVAEIVAWVWALAYVLTRPGGRSG